MPPESILTQRHAFYQRHRWPVLAAWVTVLALAVGIAWHELPLSEFDAGLILLGPVLLYLLSHQLAHRHHPWRVPKEICVALLFAAGTTCFILARDVAALRVLALPLALFAGICFANLALISLWESEVDREHGQTSLALQHPHRARLLHALPWVLAAAALAAFATHPAVAISALAASSLMLGMVDLLHSRNGRKLSRVLADAALLTPWPLWLLVALH